MKLVASNHKYPCLQTVLASLALCLMMLMFVGCEEDSNPAISSIPYGSRLFIAGDNTLQMFDPENNTWLEPVGLGLGSNQIVNDGSALFVVNSISHTLQRISSGIDGYQTTGSLDLGLERNTGPFAAIALDFPHIAVSNLLANSVSIVDVNEMEIVAEHPVGRAPEGLYSQYPWDTLFVINSGYDFSDFSFHNGSIYKMNSDDGEIVDSLIIGTNPQFCLGFQGNLHVSCTGNYQDIAGEIWIINSDSLYVKQIIEIGHSPGRMAIDRSEGLVYVAAGGWSNEGESEGLILCYDSVTYEVLDPLSASLGVVDVVWPEARGHLYAVCRDAMKLDVFDGQTKIASHDLEDPPNVLEIQVWQ
jgi:DNA-binding beta-propeller fold protein YncE